MVTYDKIDNLTNFEDISKWYIEQKNKGFEVSYNDFLDYILLEFDIIPKPNNKYVNLYNFISQIYEICYKDENSELNLNKRQLRNLKYILIDCAINKSFFDQRNTIADTDFTYKINNNSKNSLIKEYIFHESNLTDRELIILYEKYGFDGSEPKNLEIFIKY